VCGVLLILVEFADGSRVLFPAGVLLSRAIEDFIPEPLSALTDIVSRLGLDLVAAQVSVSCANSLFSRCPGYHRLPVSVKDLFLCCRQRNFSFPVVPRSSPHQFRLCRSLLRFPPLPVPACRSRLVAVFLAQLARRFGPAYPFKLANLLLWFFVSSSASAGTESRTVVGVYFDPCSILL
jgi:hypothetical protein